MNIQKETPKAAVTAKGANPASLATLGIAQHYTVRRDRCKRIVAHGPASEFFRAIARARTIRPCPAQYGPRSPSFILGKIG